MDPSTEQHDARRFKCLHAGCGASYRRKEHLARHAVRHSRSRTFVCSSCGVAFDRSDTLRRHTKIHSKVDEPSMPRASRACDRCHAQKSRCDGNFPCGICSRKGVSCSFDRGASETAGERGRQKASRNDPDGVVDYEYQDSNQGYLYRSDDDDGAPPNKRIHLDNSGEDHESAPSPLSIQSEYNVRKTFLQQEAQVQDEAIRSVDQEASNRLQLEDFLPMLNNNNNNNISTNNDQISLVDMMTTWSIDTEYYVGLYFDHFHPQWPFLFRQSFRCKRERPVLVLATVMIGLWITGEARLQRLSWEIHGRLHAMLEAQMTTWDNSHSDSRASAANPNPNENNARWPLATYQAILLFTIFALVAHRPEEMSGSDDDDEDDDDDDNDNDDDNREEALLLHRVRPIFSRLVQSCRAQGLLYYPAMLAQIRPDDPIIYAWTMLEETKLFALTLYKVDVLFSRLDTYPNNHNHNHNHNNNDDENNETLSLSLSLSDLQFPLPDNGYLWSCYPIREWFRRRELQLRDPPVVTIVGSNRRKRKRKGKKRSDGDGDGDGVDMHYDEDLSSPPWISDIFDGVEDGQQNSSKKAAARRRRAWMRLGPWLGFLAGMDPG